MENFAYVLDTQSKNIIFSLVVGLEMGGLLTWSSNSSRPCPILHLLIQVLFNVILQLS